MLLFPVDFCIWIAEKIHDIASKEMEDTLEKLQAELMNIQMALESEQITEKEYQRKENNILARMDDLKDKK